VEEAKGEKEAELEAFRSDPKNEKMLALIEQLRVIDPDEYARITTEGMKSEAEVFRESMGD
jgi:hypothetical protein